MRWFLGLARGQERRRATTGRRKLFLEHLEDRRLLATANDDNYLVSMNGSITVYGSGGLYLNDSALASGSQNSCGEGQDCRSADVVTEPAHGTLSQIWTDDPPARVAEGLEFSYEPDEDFVGIDAFSYSLCDPDGCDTATVTIYVPGISDDSYFTLPNTALDVGAFGTVLLTANDGALSSATKTSDPSHGTVSNFSGGAFVYTPDPGFHGIDTFTYEGSGAGSIWMQLYQSPPSWTVSGGTVTIVVDTPPEANDDIYSVHGGSSIVRNAATGVFGNDDDAEQDDLDIVGYTEPEFGSLVIDEENGSFTYTPDIHFSGYDSFTYTATDGVRTDTASVQIYDNVPPNISDDSYETLPQTALGRNSALGLLGNDSDLDDTLTVTANTNPAYGSVTVSSDGSFTYTPSFGFHGIDEFTYTASDGTHTETATVTITIDNMPGVWGSELDLPVNYQGPPPGTSWPSVYGAGPYDADGDSIVAILANSPSSGSLTLNPDGTFRYIPASNFTGSVTFTYVATDGMLYTPPQTVTITVHPVAYNDVVNISANTPTVIYVSSLLSNDHGPSLTIYPTSWNIRTSHGSLLSDENGNLIYTPDEDFTGFDAFEYFILSNDVLSILDAQVVFIVA